MLTTILLITGLAIGYLCIGLLSALVFSYVTKEEVMWPSLISMILFWPFWVVLVTLVIIFIGIPESFIDMREKHPTKPSLKIIIDKGSFVRRSKP